MTVEPHPCVVYLQDLAQKEKRGALAALRRGLGQPPGTVAAMYPYVVPWLPADAPPWRQAAYYLIAALFALHPQPGGSGNLGASYRRAEGEQAAARDEGVSANERRFTALLAAHPDDLPDRLRQAVGYLASKEVPIDWNQLFDDLTRWGSPQRRVQQEWARAYWGRAAQVIEPADESEEE
jgi:CRISPR system Cascade subunit CasB